MDRDADRLDSVPPDAHGGGDAAGSRAPAAGGRSPKGARGAKLAGRAAPRRSIERRSTGRVAVTQANPLALSRQEMGLLTKRLLVLALSDIAREIGRAHV